jgi:hypothetical protein
MIDQAIFLRQMAVLADRIGRPLAGPTQADYHRILSAELTTEQFVAATTLALRTLDGKYRNWPSPQQLLELIAPVSAPTLTAEEAFEKVLEIANGYQVGQFTVKAKIQELGAATVRAYHAAGGWRDFANVLEADLPWLRKRFVQAYEESCKHADADRQATLALSGAHEQVQLLTSQLAAKLAMPATKVLTP